MTNCILEGLESVCTGLSMRLPRDVGISGLMDMETSAKSSRHDLLHAMLARVNTLFEDDIKDLKEGEKIIILFDRTL